MQPIKTSATAEVFIELLSEQIRGKTLERLASVKIGQNPNSVSTCKPFVRQQ